MWECLQGDKERGNLSNYIHYDTFNLWTLSNVMKHLRAAS
jgi:hypothetical protein